MQRRVFRRIFLLQAAALALFLSLKQGCAVQDYRIVFPSTQQSVVSCSATKGTAFTSLSGSGVLGISKLQAKSCSFFSVSPRQLVSKGSTCSTLLLEFWALSYGNNSPAQQPPGTLQTADGLYVVAGLYGPPSVGVSAFTWSVGPSNVGAYYDPAAMDRSRPYHRIEIPYTPGMPATWYITVANFHPSALTLGSAAINVSCLPATQLPCNSASPLWGRCSASITAPAQQLLAPLVDMSAFAYPPTTSSSPAIPAGQCISNPHTVGPNSLFCQCADGYAGYACSMPYLNLSLLLGPSGSGLGPGLGAPPFNLTIPPRTWLHFWLPVPSGPSPWLLAELWQPPGSGAVMDPVITVKPYSQQVAGVTQVLSPPELNDLNFKSNAGAINLNETYGSIAMSLDPEQSSGMWVSLFNNAPLTQDPVAVPQLMLRVRSDSGNTQPTPSCPQDCGGAGTCAAPTWSTPQGQVTPPQYNCICSSNRGGPHCQGPLTHLNIKSTTSVSIGPVAVAPGKWQYYQLQLDSGLAKELSAEGKVLVVQLQVQGQSYAIPFSNHDPLQSRDGGNSSGLTFIVSPYSPQNQGDRFFSATGSETVTTLTGSGVLRLSPASLSPFGALMLSVYNSDEYLVQPQTYMVAISAMTPPTTGPDHQPPPPEGNPSVGRLPGVGVGSPTSWYYAVAGAAAAIMFAVATCILVRIIKQHVFARRRGRRGGRLLGGGAGVQLGRRGRTLGVPPELLTFFPTLTFTPDMDLKAEISKVAALATADLQENGATIVAAALDSLPPVPAVPAVPALQQQGASTSTAGPPTLEAGMVVTTGSADQGSNQAATPPGNVPQAGSAAGGEGPVVARADAALAVTTLDALEQHVITIHDGASSSSSTASAAAVAADVQPTALVGQPGAAGAAGSSSSAPAVSGVTPGAVMVRIERDSAIDLHQSHVGPEEKEEVPVVNQAEAEASSMTMCTVCLEDYEAGEKLRALLPCSHTFHMTCIDAWLGTHDTCPICRTNLVPDVFLPLQQHREALRQRQVAVPMATAAAATARDTVSDTQQGGPDSGQLQAAATGPRWLLNPVTSLGRLLRGVAQSPPPEATSPAPALGTPVVPVQGVQSEAPAGSPESAPMHGSIASAVGVNDHHLSAPAGAGPVPALFADAVPDGAVQSQQQALHRSSDLPCDTSRDRLGRQQPPEVQHLHYQAAAAPPATNIVGNI